MHHPQLQWWTEGRRREIWTSGSASVLKGEVLERARMLLDEGRSVPEVASELKVLANTLHKAIRAGRLPAPQKKRNAAARL